MYCMRPCMYSRVMPRRYSMDARQEETAARRRRLLDAAIEVLGQVGADRLTMEMVAERADAATRTLYNHFSTRDELIAEALDRLLEEARDALYLGAPEPGDPVGQLRAFAQLVYGIYDRQGASLTTLLDHRSEPRIDAQITQMRAQRREYLERVLAGAGSALLLPVPQA